jgi:probable F420-dependent oxidoreductase
MRYGLCVPNFPFGVRPSGPAMLEIAQAAERHGFDSAWLTDHVLVPRDKPRYGVLYEVLASMAWLGAQTKTLRFGTSILVIAQRDAILVGKQAATIDDLTGGRVILGIGLGWVEAEFRNLGADFKQRARRVDDSIDMMRALWSSKTPRYEGAFYNFTDALFEPLPPKGGIPIWVGGNSEAALRRAAARGDNWHADDLVGDPLRENVATLQRFAAEKHRKVEVSVRRTIDLRPAMAGAKDGAGTGAPILTGSAGEIRAGVADLRASGVDDLILQIEHHTQEEHLAQIAYFAREIAPHAG